MTVNALGEEVKQNENGEWVPVKETDAGKQDPSDEKVRVEDDTDQFQSEYNK